AGTPPVPGRNRNRRWRMGTLVLMQTVWALLNWVMLGSVWLGRMRRSVCADTEIAGSNRTRSIRRRMQPRDWRCAVAIRITLNTQKAGQMLQCEGDQNCNREWTPITANGTESD